jgi:hypothetical protein
MADGLPRTPEGQALLAQVARRIREAEDELEREDRLAPLRSGFSPAEARMLQARGVTLAQAEHRLRTSGA